MSPLLWRGIIIECAHGRNIMTSHSSVHRSKSLHATSDARLNSTRAARMKDQKEPKEIPEAEIAVDTNKSTTNAATVRPPSRISIKSSTTSRSTSSKASGWIRPHPTRTNSTSFSCNENITVDRVGGKMALVRRSKKKDRSRADKQSRGLQLEEPAGVSMSKCQHEAVMEEMIAQGDDPGGAADQILHTQPVGPDFCDNIGRDKTHGQVSASASGYGPLPNNRDFGTPRYSNPNLTWPTWFHKSAQAAPAKIAPFFDKHNIHDNIYHEENQNRCPPKVAAIPLSWNLPSVKDCFADFVNCDPRCWKYKGSVNALIYDFVNLNYDLQQDLWDVIDAEQKRCDDELDDAMSYMEDDVSDVLGRKTVRDV